MAAVRLAVVALLLMVCIDMVHGVSVDALKRHSHARKGHHHRRRGDPIKISLKTFDPDSEGVESSKTREVNVKDPDVLKFREMLAGEKLQGLLNYHRDFGFYVNDKDTPIDKSEFDKTLSAIGVKAGDVISLKPVVKKVEVVEKKPKAVTKEITFKWTNVLGSKSGEYKYTVTASSTFTDTFTDLDKFNMRAYTSDKDKDKRDRPFQFSAPLSMRQLLVDVDEKFLKGGLKASDYKDAFWSTLKTKRLDEVLDFSKDDIVIVIKPNPKNVQPSDAPLNKLLGAGAKLKDERITDTLKTIKEVDEVANKKKQDFVGGGDGVKGGNIVAGLGKIETAPKQPGWTSREFTFSMELESNPSDNIRGAVCYLPASYKKGKEDRYDTWGKLTAEERLSQIRRLAEGAGKDEFTIEGNAIKIKKGSWSDWQKLPFEKDSQKMCYDYYAPKLHHENNNNWEVRHKGLIGSPDEILDRVGKAIKAFHPSLSGVAHAQTHIVFEQPKDFKVRANVFSLMLLYRDFITLRTVNGFFGAGHSGFKFDYMTVKSLFESTADTAIGVVTFKEDPVGWRGQMYTDKAEDGDKVNNDLIGMETRAIPPNDFMADYGEANPESAPISFKAVYRRITSLLGSYDGKKDIDVSMRLGGPSYKLSDLHAWQKDVRMAKDTFSSAEEGMQRFLLGTHWDTFPSVAADSKLKDAIGEARKKALELNANKLTHDWIVELKNTETKAERVEAIEKAIAALASLGEVISRAL